MQLYKRGKHFWVRFTVRGRQYRQSTKETTRTAAAVAASDIVKQVQSTGKTPAKDEPIPTLREFARGWFTDFITGNSRLTEKSKEYYLYGILLLDNQRVMSMQLDAITSEDADMIRTDHSASTHNTALRTLRRMLNLAAKRGIINKVPRIQLLVENRRTRLVEPTDEAKIEAVLRGYKHKRGALQTGLCLILDSGMRPMEIASMRIEDVSFERGYIYVPKSKTRAGARYLPMSDRMKEKLFVQIGDRTSGWVFPSKKYLGYPIKSKALGRAWTLACAAAGVSSDLKFYCGRHTFATDAMTMTKNPFLVMKALGHTELSTTERYQHHDIIELGDRMNERNKRREAVTLN